MPDGNFTAIDPVAGRAVASVKATAMPVFPLLFTSCSASTVAEAVVKVPTIVAAAAPGMVWVT
jgi:hypothetical protein